MAKPTTSQFFNSYAHDFNAIYGTKNTPLNRLINKYLRKSMKYRFEKTISRCNPIQGKSVIDIGCGPGHFGITLAQKGAEDVLGLDFADEMGNLARQHAACAGVANRCRFEIADFLQYENDKRFDYAIVMGFMDYIDQPARVIQKVLGLTQDKAFFSFPVASGILAWQRKWRYRQRCDLFLYTFDQLEALFGESTQRDAKVEIEIISRDFFVTVTMP